MAHEFLAAYCEKVKNPKAALQQACEATRHSFKPTASKPDKNTKNHANKNKSSINAKTLDISIAAK
ncbi:MAG: hypothetical protein Q4A97_08070 [Comamonadaceae bacterium]|nr:hypothetical protein [Comamonadaceae bacterium]